MAISNILNAIGYSGSLNYNSANYGLVNKRTNSFSMTFSNTNKESYQLNSARLVGSSALSGKYSGKNLGSMKYHGSTAMIRSGSKYGSISHSGSGAKYGSISHSGSSAKYGSISHSGSGSKYGSISHSGSIAKYGSISHSGSGSKYGSGGHKSYIGLFSPTQSPTETLPEIIRPPPPTYYPTVSNFHKIKINLSPVKTDDSIEVPDIPVSFQIQQGTNGWSSYPNSHQLQPVLSKVVADISGLNEEALSNVVVLKSNIDRRLSISVIIEYTITTTPLDVGVKKPHLAYIKIANLLSNAAINRVLSSKMKEEFKHTNLTFDGEITSIWFSNYNILYPTMAPTQIQAINSLGKSDDVNKTSNNLYISMGCIFAFVFLMTFYYIKRSRDKLKSAQIIDVVSNVPNPVTRNISSMIEIVDVHRDSIPKRLSL